MAWNNVYIGTPNPVGNYQGSAASTVLSDLSVAGSIDANNVDVIGTLTTDSATVTSDLSLVGNLLAAGATFQSILTVSGSNTANFLSVDTQTDASGMTTGQLRLVFAASGVSLMFSSGASQYEVGSARSLAQS